MADKTKLGIEVPPYTFEVEKVKIAEFAMAISQKESNDHFKPTYWDSAAAKASGYGDIIPWLTFQTCFALWSRGGLMPMLQAIGINLGRLLHGQEEYEYLINLYS
jgi:hypothetical protein